MDQATSMVQWGAWPARVKLHGLRAVADGFSGGPELKALAAQLTGPDIRRALYPGEALALDVFLNWATLWSTGTRSLRQSLRVLRNLKRACHHLPLRDADLLVVGQPVRFWRELLAHHDPKATWWQAQNAWAAVAQVRVPVH